LGAFFYAHKSNYPTKADFIKRKDTIELVKLKLA